MPRCSVCGRKLKIDRTNNRLILRCPKHGVVLRYYAKPNNTTPPPARRRR